MLLLFTLNLVKTPKRPMQQSSRRQMDAPVNDKRTYEVLERDPTPALQRKLNNKLLTLKKTDKIDCRRYSRLRCSVSQPPKLYGLPTVHKPNIPMWPIVSFCGSPTYQLPKYLTNELKPLTDKSGHKLQSTVNLIDAIKTIQIPDDHKLVSFDVKSLVTSVALQLALGSIHNLSRGWAMMISISPPPIISGFFLPPLKRC